MPVLNNSHDSSVLVSAPAFSHTLRFLDPQLEDAFQDFLRDQAQTNLALYPSTKERYVLFSLLFFSNICIVALGYLVDNFSYELSGGGLAIQFVGLVILVSTGLSVIAVSYRLRDRPKLFTRLLIGLFTTSASLYTVLDSSLVYKTVSSESLKPTLVGLIPLLVTLLAMQYLFSCEFCFFGLTSGAAAAIYLGVHLAAQDRGSSQILLESSIFSISAVFLTRRAYTLEKAVRLAFLLDLNDTKGHKSSKSSNSVPANSSVSHSSELEDILNKISNVRAAVADASAVVTYQDIRARLKTALKDLDLASSKLTLQAPNIFQPQIPRVERINQDIDEEDRVFVQQNFMMTKASDYATPAAPTTQKDVVSLNINLEYGLSELLAVMNQLGKNWNFDMFFVHEMTKGKPLGVTGRFCLSKFDLSAKFNIPDVTAQKFFSAMEGQYKNNPYHNSTHGADVLNSTFFLFNHSFIIGHMTDVEILGAVIATLGHDVGHGSLTNRFLVNNRDGLAITCTPYTDNDISVLEMMHASITYSLLQVEDQNILKSLDSDSWMLARKVVLKMILATDMARHFELLGQFRATHPAIDPSKVNKIDERISVSEMCIKAADIGHAAKMLDLHEKWTLLVCEEFFQQGDLEKKLGLPVSMYCDRETTDISKVTFIQSQMGFIQNIVLPLYECINNFLGSKEVDTFCIEQLRVNMTAWESKGKKKRRYTIKSKPTELAVPKNEFQKLSDKIRNWKRG